MTEQVGTPFTSYNQESSPRVLTGNFFEERALLATTGISRRRLVPPSSHPAPSAAGSSGAGDTTAHGFALPSIFPLPEERAANKAQPPTFRRVIEHTEQQVRSRSACASQWDYRVAQLTDLQDCVTAVRCMPKLRVLPHSFLFPASSSSKPLPCMPPVNITGPQRVGQPRSLCPPGAQRSEEHPPRLFSGCTRHGPQGGIRAAQAQAVGGS